MKSAKEGELKDPSEEFKKPMLKKGAAAGRGRKPNHLENEDLSNPGYLSRSSSSESDLSVPAGPEAGPKRRRSRGGHGASTDSR